MEVTPSMLQPLINRARAEKKWLRVRSFLHDDIIFSPDELEKENYSRRYLWGPDNWVLIDPADYLAQLAKKVDTARAEMNAFIKRLGPQHD